MSILGANFQSLQPLDGLKKKEEPVEDDSELTLRQKNRKRTEKMLQDAMTGNIGGANVRPQQQSQGLKLDPLQPLGNFQGGQQTGPPQVGGDWSETDSKGTKGLDSRFDNNIQKMMQDAPGGLTIYSGRRTSDRQTELWKKALQKYGSESAARQWVAPPAGTRLSDGSVARGSRHESGVAADLSYANDATKRWVHENAHRYGLHFPLDNEDWHVEPIGSR